MRLTIRKKLTISLVLQVASIAAVTFFVLFVIVGLVKVVDGISDYIEIQKEVKAAKDLTLNASQIWQFATDAALTKDRKVLTQKAKAALDAAYGNIDAIIGMDKDEPGHVKRLTATKKDLQAMYSIGERMFDAYMTSHEKGNAVMAELDKTGEKVLAETAAYAEGEEKAGERIAAALAGKAKSILGITEVLAVFIAISLVLVIVAMALIGRSLRKPVQDIFEIVKTVTSGNLKFGKQNFHTTHDEVGELIRQEITMVETLNKMFIGILGQTGQVAGALKLLIERQNEAAGEAYKQVSQSKEINTVVEETNATVARLAESISETSKSAVAVTDSSSAHEETVNAMKEGMNNFSALMSDLQLDISNLTQETAGIDQIVGTITDIAEQTNLLALNAAIEAARAGEQGRGFAVVADEVRKLAERTKNSTAEISQKLKIVKASSSQTADHMVLALDNLVGTIDHTNSVGQHLSEVIEASRRITAEMVQCSDSMNQLAAQSRQLSATTADGLAAATAIISGVEVSLHEALKIILKVDELRAQTAQFKVDISTHDFITLVQGDHLIFLYKIMAHMKGLITLDPTKIADHHSCRMGKWYDTEGKASCNHLPAFKEIDGVHESFHKTARKLLEEVDPARREQLFAEMKRDSERVIELLENLKKQVS